MPGTSDTGSIGPCGRWSERKIIVSLFLSLWLTYAFFVPTSHPNNANALSRIGLTWSLVETGSLNIDFIAAATIDKAFSDGHYFSDKAPGASFTAAIPVAAFVWSLKALGEHPVFFDGDKVSPVGVLTLFIATVFTSSLFTAAAAAMIYVLARHWDASRGAALFAAVSFGLATPAAEQATLFFGHALAGACLWIGFATTVVVVERKESSGNDLGLAFVAGMVLAWAAITDFTAAPACFIVAIYGVIRTSSWPARRRRNVVAGAVLAGLLTAVPLLVYNSMAFDSPFNLSYSRVVGFDLMKQGFMGVSMPRADVVYQLVIGKRVGLLWFMPIGLVWPWALWTCRHRLSHETLGVLFFVPLSFLLINAGYVYWDGGATTGPRFLTPSLAFICFPLAFLWMFIGRAWRGVVLALAGISGLVTLICLSVDIDTSDTTYADPICEYLLPRFLDGRIHDAITTAIAYLHIRDAWTTSIAQHATDSSLVGWQGLATLAILPAAWLIVAAVVRQSRFV